MPIFPKGGDLSYGYLTKLPGGGDLTKKSVRILPIRISMAAEQVGGKSPSSGRDFRYRKASK